VWSVCEVLKEIIMTDEWEIVMDGSVTINPGGIGKWAAIIKHNDKEMIFSGEEKNSTNNRMESMGLIFTLPPILVRGYKNIVITTDSMYVVYCLRGWEKRIKKMIKYPNVDIWLPVYSMISVYKPIITCNWVKGHSGHVDNERVDILCSAK
jgi:ribonuclease HI